MILVSTVHDRAPSDGFHPTSELVNIARSRYPQHSTAIDLASIDTYIEELYLRVVWLNQLSLNLRVQLVNDDRDLIENDLKMT